jgi:hypothetical protein
MLPALGRGTGGQGQGWGLNPRNFRARGSAPQPEYEPPAPSLPRLLQAASLAAVGHISRSVAASSQAPQDLTLPLPNSNPITPNPYPVAELSHPTQLNTSYMGTLIAPASPHQ